MKMQCKNYCQQTTLVMRCEKEQGHEGIHEAKYERFNEAKDEYETATACWTDKAGKEMEDARSDGEKLESLPRITKGRKVKGYRREDSEQPKGQDEKETDEEANEEGNEEEGDEEET